MIPDLKPTTGVFEGKTYYLPIRLYWEDTDTGGVVYHGNYVSYFERARTEMLRAAGLPHSDMMMGDDPTIWVISKVEINYKRSAFMDDEVVVTASVEKLGGASMVMTQEMWRGEELLAEARFRIAVTDKNGKPKRLPKKLFDKMKTLLPE
jgi:acyl-CoA thioester hydrolase